MTWDIYLLTAALVPCSRHSSAYHLAGASLTLDLGYLLTVTPALCSYFCFIDYTKAFDCVDHNKLWKILKEMGIPDHLTCLLRNLYAGQEATELNMEQQTGSNSGMEYVKVVYCHPAYLTYKQCTS